MTTCVCVATAFVLRSANRSFSKYYRILPTERELARFRAYARRIRTLKEDFGCTLPWEPLLDLKFRLGGKPLLPSLKSLELARIEEKHAPLIPLFLSPRITSVYLEFRTDFHEAVLASVITALPTLCPNLREISLPSLPSGPMITVAVSKMLLAVNRSSLQRLRVSSPLTEEATQSLCDLRDIRELSMAIGRCGS
jgi:hypothetical protein